MSRFVSSGRDPWSNPRNRNDWQRRNSGRFAEAMRFRRGSIGALALLTILIVGSILA